MFEVKPFKRQINPDKTIYKSAFSFENGRYQCQRCLSEFPENLFLIKNQKVNYCPYCQKMGMVHTTDSIPYQKEEEGSQRDVLLQMDYSLSSFQKKASQWLLQSYKRKKKHLLLWAVTGAGKTEMTFLLILKVLKEGKKVVWASPRIDVCLEIFPRLKKSFPEEKIVLLYGNSQEIYEGESFVVATTHQLMRFKETFDLLIIDEVDAFPYVTEEILQKTSFQALKKEGLFLSLTATPTKNQIKEMKKNNLAFYLLPARFHRNPLVVPEFYWLYDYRKRLLKKLPKKVYQLLSHHRWLIFCPEIKWMQKFVEVLTDVFPKKSVVSIHAKDLKREEKVEDLRKEKYDLICTTTILERGVTLKNIHVLVIGSHERIYKKEVLVQIAGRVGRHPDYPKGAVIFLHSGLTKEMKKAKEEIEDLNAFAKKEGYLF